MNSINPVKNQYRGINAHLHSFWQSEGGWDSFHTNHISDLMREMNKHLFPLGYVADIEPSLQIRCLDEIDEDVIVYAANQNGRKLRTFRSGETVGISELLHLEEVSDYHAVAIYEYTIGKRITQLPVLWIELMSPSNKGDKQNASQYRRKRQDLLRDGVAFIEIDYLHETLPNFRFDSITQTHPYHIVVINPRPSLYEGLAYPYHFDTDDIIPMVKIPLKREDEILFDFGAAYIKTLDETYYTRHLIDYSQLPLNFDRYSSDDQARILNRMIAVIEAAQQEIDLNTAAPLRVGTLSLNEALTRIQDLGVVT